MIIIVHERNSAVSVLAYKRLTFVAVQLVSSRHSVVSQRHRIEPGFDVNLTYVIVQTEAYVGKSICRQKTMLTP